MLTFFTPSPSRILTKLTGYLLSHFCSHPPLDCLIHYIMGCLPHFLLAMVWESLTFLMMVQTVFCKLFLPFRVDVISGWPPIGKLDRLTNNSLPVLTQCLPFSLLPLNLPPRNAQRKRWSSSTSSSFLLLCVFELVQGSRIRFVLGCVIPRAGAVARSRNLGQALCGSPVVHPSSQSSL